MTRKCVTYKSARERSKTIYADEVSHRENGVKVFGDEEISFIPYENIVIIRHLQE